MAFPKISSFSKQHQSLATFAAALAHPARIAIITLLQESKEASCGQIVESLPLAQATVSQHLRCLTEAGLLRLRQEGPKVLYSIDCDAVKAFCHNFQCTLGTDSNPSA